MPNTQKFVQDAVLLLSQVRSFATTAELLLAVRLKQKKILLLQKSRTKSLGL